MDDLFDDIPPDQARVTGAMREVALGLARAFLAGQHSPSELRERGSRALGRPWPWLTSLCLRIHFDFRDVWHSGIVEDLTALILDDQRFRGAFRGGSDTPRLRTHYPWHPVMAPPPAPFSGLAIPALATPGELADWLGITPNQLDWFAGRSGIDRPGHPARFRHYRYQWQPKRQGGWRLIEAPKTRLRDLQRLILRGILDLLPPHSAAHGCVRGRSVISNASQHLAAPLLLKLDLRDFFPSIPGGRVFALFRTLGYPAATARYLAEISTHRAPAEVLRDAPTEDYLSPGERRRHQRWLRRFREPHLPQGAPTSAALANLCAYRLDLRLASAAAECGATYTRYVDDLTFSCRSPNRPQGRRILAMVGEIALEEGFIPNWRKSQLESPSVCQRVTGIVVNRHANLARRDYDELRAILTNCLRHGPATQNRHELPDFRRHLLGKIAWFAQVNPNRAEKLMKLFSAISWV